MEEILKQMIEQLQSLEWGEAQENVDGALAYLGCAVQNLRNPTTGAVDFASVPVKNCALDFGGYACSCGLHESQSH